MEIQKSQKTLEKNQKKIKKESKKKTNPWLFPENPKKSLKIQDLILF